MNMMGDSLHYWPTAKWNELQAVFKADWPRGIGGYSALENQKTWLECGIDYGFKVYCPFGEVRNGLVGINKKVSK